MYLLSSLSGSPVGRAVSWALVVQRRHLVGVLILPVSSLRRTCISYQVDYYSSPKPGTTVQQQAVRQCPRCEYSVGAGARIHFSPAVGYDSPSKCFPAVGPIYCCCARVWDTYLSRTLHYSSSTKHRRVRVSS